MLGRLFDERGAVFGDQRVDDAFELRQRAIGFSDPMREGGAIDRAVLDGVRTELCDERDSLAAFGIEFMNNGVGVPNGDACIAEHLAGRCFAHADGASQADHEGSVHRSTACLSCSSTSGCKPNQRSKPGAAWKSSMPRPSTVRQPMERACFRRGVSSGV